MRKLMSFLILITMMLLNSSYALNRPTNSELAKQNLERAIVICDSTTATFLKGEEMKMPRFYNPYIEEYLDETASVWMYTSGIEAVNAILHGLKLGKEQGQTDLYDKHYNRYVALLDNLYDNLEYYAGTFTLTSYTQTKAWTVYAVDRVNNKGEANVSGILNVYDDQEWLARELIESYNITGNKDYLEKAEYLTEYVLDGWDTYTDEHGDEYGGITWGPGYISKHACSNGPMISPLVWLSEIYKDKDETIKRRYIDKEGNRLTAIEAKNEYYLTYAKKIYAWQKAHLLKSNGVYWDMLGPGGDKVQYEIVNGIEYRKHIPSDGPSGREHSYNAGSMLSGAADLYRVTKDETYLRDVRQLSDTSFDFFARLGETVPGYYSYKVDGFTNWFNGVLMRAWVDAAPCHEHAARYADSFQRNLDYGYENFLYKGFLPTNVLAGWNVEPEHNAIEGMFQFTFAAEYAVLSKQLYSVK